ncbi:unnamed protein product, partial [Owenia fusiformis]
MTDLTQYLKRTFNIIIYMVTLHSMVRSDIQPYPDDVEISSNSAFGEVKVEKVSRTRHKRGAGDIRSTLVFDQKATIILAHNQARSSVSPKAADMLFMTWDDDLASMAQEWAEKCTWEHGNPERNPKPYSSIGQNLWAGTGSPSVNGAVNSWDNERRYYTFDTRACQSGKVCGHYTQVAWADSHKVGCGAARCTKNSPFSASTWNYVVCNYGPAGNYVGRHPYTKSSTSCSACPSDKPVCENNLCKPSGVCGGQTCFNNGKYVTSVCMCNCTTGWTGVTCQQSLSNHITAS